MQFQRLSNETSFAHPITWQELFNPNTELADPNHDLSIGNFRKFLPPTFTIDALSKLLMFGDYAKARAEAQGCNSMGDEACLNMCAQIDGRSILPLVQN